MDRQTIPTQAAFEREAERQNRSVDDIHADYLLVTLAQALSAQYGSKLCFKGGFVLRHVHEQDRISGDVDATRLEPSGLSLDSNAVKKVIRDTFRKPFDIGLIKVVNDSENSLDIAMTNVRGRMTTKQVALEISYREGTVLPPVAELIGKPFHPLFQIMAMQPKEIAAEKVRCIVQRERATDMSDLYYCAKRFDPAAGDPTMRDLVQRKLEPRAHTFPNPAGLFEATVERLERDYTATVHDLAPDAPTYAEAVEVILPLALSWIT